MGQKEKMASLSKIKGLRDAARTVGDSLKDACRVFDADSSGSERQKKKGAAF